MASLSKNNTFYQTLVGTASDALNNLFKVVITKNDGSFENMSPNATVRCSDFTPPTFQQQTYEARYITAKITKPAAKIVGDKRFDITFRLDAYYSLYREFLKNQKEFSNFSQNSYEMNLAYADMYTIKVYALQSETEENIELFRFGRCWTIGVTPPSFTTENSAPATIKVSFRFIDYEDLSNL